MTSKRLQNSGLSRRIYRGISSKLGGEEWLKWEYIRRIYMYEYPQFSTSYVMLGRSLES